MTKYLKKKKKFKRGMVYFGSRFQRFHSMACRLHHCGSDIRQNTMVVGACCTVTLLVARKEGVGEDRQIDGRMDGQGL